MGSNESHMWMSLGGVGHVELIVEFFGLTGCNGVGGLLPLGKRADSCSNV